MGILDGNLCSTGKKKRERKQQVGIGSSRVKVQFQIWCSERPLVPRREHLIKKCMNTSK